MEIAQSNQCAEDAVCDQDFSVYLDRGPQVDPKLPHHAEHPRSPPTTRTQVGPALVVLRNPKSYQIVHEAQAEVVQAYNPGLPNIMHHASW
jgi:hypothetical protein